MHSQYSFRPEFLCSSSAAESPSPSSSSMEEGTVSPGAPSSSILTRVAMRASRARWFTFLRRVYHYQNGSRSDLGSNPYDSIAWMMLEFASLVVQLSASAFILATSNNENPLWSIRVWIIGYDIGCFLGLHMLCGRFHHLYFTRGDDAGLLDLEQNQENDESSSHSSSHWMNKCQTSLELFFAVWFVMGTIWVFDSHLGSLQQAPKIHILCICLLAWSALCYSFPFILFVLLCCCVPFLSRLLGYNMNMGASERGASDDQISSLPRWRYKEINTGMDDENGGCNSRPTDNPCCICLSKYRTKEEVRQLPCSHVFHLRCVDQWLRIISCCPLCKQQLER